MFNQKHLILIVNAFLLTSCAAATLSVRSPAEIIPGRSGKWLLVHLRSASWQLNLKLRETVPGKLSCIAE
ncbi:MAG: hypothetical protein CM1200mP28_13240 [Deltaproteobacteria bacterium]|nr:MAG: hypothetical protein CM1200mP28_13240 [Deltaproteobacteria bacterium]